MILFAQELLELLAHSFIAYLNFILCVQFVQISTFTMFKDITRCFTSGLRIGAQSDFGDQCSLLIKLLGFVLD